MKIKPPIIFIIFKYLPFWALYLLSDFLFLLVRFIIPYRKKIIDKNLLLSFPEKSKAELREIRNNYYRHLSDLLVEGLKMYGLSNKELQKRMKFRNPEVLEKLFLENKSVIGIGSHYGNWEWGSLILPTVCKHKTLGVYKPLSNEKWNTFMKSMRAQKGMKLIAMKDVLRELITLKKETTLTILISDQSPMKAEIQYWTPFLNQETPIYLGPEKLAKSTGYPVFFIKMEKIKRGYYEFEFILISENPKEEKEFFISNTHVKLLENQIKEHPENWLWSHNRWKHSPKN